MLLEIDVAAVVLSARGHPTVCCVGRRTCFPQIPWWLRTNNALRSCDLPSIVLVQITDLSSLGCQACHYRPTTAATHMQPAHIQLPRISAPPPSPVVASVARDASKAFVFVVFSCMKKGHLSAVAHNPGATGTPCHTMALRKANHGATQDLRAEKLAQHQWCISYNATHTGTGRRRPSACQ